MTGTRSGGKVWLKNVDLSPLPTIPHRKIRETGNTGTDITFGQQTKGGGKGDALLGTNNSSSNSTQRRSIGGPLDRSISSSAKSNTIKFSQNDIYSKPQNSQLVNFRYLSGEGRHNADRMGESDLEPGQKGLLGNAGTNGKSSGNGSSSNGKHDITASTPVVAVSSHAAHGVKNVHAPMPMARGGLHAQASVGLGNPGKNGFDSPADSPPDSPEGSPAVASSPSDPERDIGNGMTASHVDYATNPIPPQNPVTVMPGMNMNVLALDPVPYRLRCMADLSRTHRLRTTTFLGRSQKQLRPTDLVLAAQDVSKIHCSITAIGNAIAGYRLSVVVTADAKAPVSVNGAKLKEKGKPYPLKVGDVLLVGLREMWKIERSVMAEMPPKHVVDELDLYEGHNEFLQLAVSDVETFRNVLLTIVW